jgi:hypothetical protein
MKRVNIFLAALSSLSMGILVGSLVFSDLPALGQYEADTNPCRETLRTCEEDPTIGNQCKEGVDRAECDRDRRECICRSRTTPPISCVCQIPPG